MFPDIVSISRQRNCVNATTNKTAYTYAVFCRIMSIEDIKYYNSFLFVISQITSNLSLLTG